MADSPGQISQNEKTRDDAYYHPGKDIDELPGHVETVEDLAKLELAEIQLSDAEKAKVMRKLDYILVPQLTLLYLLAFLDRSNSTYSPEPEQF